MFFLPFHRVIGRSNLGEEVGDVAESKVKGMIGLALECV